MNNERQGAGGCGAADIIDNLQGLSALSTPQDGGRVC
jgi:hypothetical protein